MRPRTLLRIARWEVTKNAGGVDRRTVLVGVAAVAVLAILAPLAAGQGAGLGEGLYRVGIAQDSPYYGAVDDDDTFAVRPPEEAALRGGSIDLLVRDRTVAPADSPKGRAAAAALRDAVERYNDRQLREDPNETAAFPVGVTLRYETQEGVGTGVEIGSGTTGSGADGTGGDVGSSGDTSDDSANGSSGGSGADGGSGAEDGSGTNGGSTTDSETDGGSGDTGGTTDGPTTGDDEESGSSNDGLGSGTDGRSDDRAGGSGTATVDGGTDDGGSAAGGFGSQPSGGASSVDSPSQLAPPFPFDSLLLAFVFVVPLNFLIQAYGSTILSERLNRRGELLLVAPVSRLEIVGGKTLPYFAGAVLIEGAIAVGLTYVSQGALGGLVSVAAVIPLVALFLAATFLGAMFARSFKELTFVTVTVTVALTTYAFVPAIFTDVTPVALISPLTIVVRDLQGQAVAAPEFLFSTGPPLLSALVLFGLGMGLYREEDMFAQRPISLKILDALAGRITRRWHVLALTALLLPFVFVLELLAIAVLFALGGLSVPLVLVAVAVVEEIAKSIHVYAAYEHGRFDRLPTTAVVVGALSGVGFFLGEKITLLAQLVGLPQLAIGRAALDPVSGPLVVAFLLAPLALHVVTAVVSALGASRGRRPYVAALGLAIAAHLAYNYAVVVHLG